MKKKTLLLSLITSVLMLSAVQQVFADDTVYGWQLMSEQERKEHRMKMQSFKTEQERERYRMEHHKKMMERAKKQGVTLPEPSARGKGMKQGQGNGMMQGQGGGAKNR